MKIVTLVASATLVLGSLACGGDDEGAGGSGTGTATGTGTGTGVGGSGTGTNTGTGGSGGTNTGTGGSATGTGGMGTGGGSSSECDQICKQAEMMGCPDNQCLSNCNNIASSAMNTGCEAELKSYFDCMLALPDICNATECNDEIQAVSQCTMGN